MYFLLIIVAIFYGAFRGTKEGMVMVQPADTNYRSTALSSGVRAHKWFRMYHFFGTVSTVILIVIVALIGKLTCVEATANVLEVSALFIAGLIVIAWETFEIGYSYARYSELIPQTELITFMDIIRYRLIGWQVKAMHLFRTGIAVIILIGG